MPEGAARIASDLMDVPHVAGRRISVIQIHKQVVEGPWNMQQLSVELELEPADIRAALEYYQANKDEMEALREEMEQEKAALRKEIAENRPEGISPP